MRTLLRDRVGQWVSLALLSGLAAGTWVMSSLPNRVGSLSASASDDEVVSVITGAEIRRTGESGQPVQRVRAERIEQKRSGVAELQSPQLQQSPLNQAEIIVRSRRALISEDQDTVFLEGDVTLVRSSFRDETAVTVSTESLTYAVEEGVARSSDTVRVLRGASELHGTGMVVNQKDGQLQILSETRMVLPRSTPQPHSRSQQ